MLLKAWDSSQWEAFMTYGGRKLCDCSVVFNKCPVNTVRKHLSCPEKPQCLSAAPRSHKCLGWDDKGGGGDHAVSC